MELLTSKLPFKALKHIFKKGEIFTAVQNIYSDFLDLSLAETKDRDLFSFPKIRICLWIFMPKLLFILMTTAMLTPFLLL